MTKLLTFWKKGRFVYIGHRSLMLPTKTINNDAIIAMFTSF